MTVDEVNTKVADLLGLGYWVLVGRNSHGRFRPAEVEAHGRPLMIYHEVSTEYIEEDDGWRAYCHGHRATGRTSLEAGMRVLIEFSGGRPLAVASPLDSAASAQ
jgi:hypothetical protein